MGFLQRYRDAFRTGDRNQMAQAISDIDSFFEEVQARGGWTHGRHVDSPAQLRTPVAVPPPSLFSVVGLDGHFFVSITPPQNVQARDVSLQYARNKRGPNGLSGLNALGGKIIYNLQSATALTFDASSTVTDYGNSQQLSYDIRNANQNFFWRLRSSYDGVNWSGWGYFLDPVTCGPALVWSGLVRNAAAAFLVTAYASNGGSPLTQHGVTTQIDAGGSSWSAGDSFSGSTRVIPYNSGSVDPGVFGTFYVYAIDQQQKGGTVIYIATANIADINGFDGLVYFGKITTAGGGGGSGSGGGGGPCCIAGTLVETQRGPRAIETLRKGDEVTNLAGEVDRLASDPEIAGNVPCFALLLSDGTVAQGFSTRHSIQLAGGSFVFLFDVRKGDSIRTLKGNALRTSKGTAFVVERKFIGHKTVYKLHLDGDRTYWADGVASHNANSK